MLKVNKQYIKERQRVIDKALSLMGHYVMHGNEFGVEDMHRVIVNNKQAIKIVKQRRFYEL